MYKQAGGEEKYDPASELGNFGSVQKENTAFKRMEKTQAENTIY